MKCLQWEDRLKCVEAEDLYVLKPPYQKSKASSVQQLWTSLYFLLDSLAKNEVVTSGLLDFIVGRSYTAGKISQNYKAME